MTPNEETATEDAPRGPGISAKSALLGFLLIVATFVAAGLYLSAEIKLQRVETAAATQRAAIEQRAVRGTRGPAGPRERRGGGPGRGAPEDGGATAQLGGSTGAAGQELP